MASRIVRNIRIECVGPRIGDLSNSFILDELDSFMTTLQLRELIERRVGFKVNQLTLINSFETLVLSQSLSFYNISDNETIVAILLNPFIPSDQQTNLNPLNLSDLPPASHHNYDMFSFFSSQPTSSFNSNSLCSPSLAINLPNIATATSSPPSSYSPYSSISSSSSPSSSSSQTSYVPNHSVISPPSSPQNSNSVDDNESFFFFTPLLRNSNPPLRYEEFSNFIQLPNIQSTQLPQQNSSSLLHSSINSFEFLVSSSNPSLPSLNDTNSPFDTFFSYPDLFSQSSSTSLNSQKETNCGDPHSSFRQQKYESASPPFKKEKLNHIYESNNSHQSFEKNDLYSLCYTLRQFSPKIPGLEGLIDQFQSQIQQLELSKSISEGSNQSLKKQIHSLEQKMKKIEEEKDLLQQEVDYLKGKGLSKFPKSRLEEIEAVILNSFTLVREAINEASKNERTCPICFVKEKTHCMVPCGHTYCETCINKLDKCAFDQKKPTNKLKLF